MKLIVDSDNGRWVEIAIIALVQKIECALLALPAYKKLEKTYKTSLISTFHLRWVVCNTVFAPHNRNTGHHEVKVEWCGEVRKTTGDNYYWPHSSGYVVLAQANLQLYPYDDKEIRCRDLADPQAIATKFLEVLEGNLLERVVPVETKIDSNE